MITEHPCQINASNLADIISHMPEGGRNYLAWFLTQGITSFLDWHLKIAIEQYQAEQERLQQWADEWENRHSMEKAA